MLLPWLIAAAAAAVAVASAALSGALVAQGRRHRAALDAAVASRDAWRATAARDARLVELGLHLAELAHELRAPLQQLTLAHDLAEMAGQTGPCHAQAVASVDRMTALCDRLLREGRPEVEAKADPAAAVDDAVALIPRHDRDRVQVHAAPPLPAVPLGPVALSQVVHNLVRNALQHAPGVWVEAHATGEAVTLAVHDDGPGVPEAARAGLFEAFATGRAASGGTGLGLHLVRRLVDEAGGEVVVTDSTRGGACFVVTLPLVRSGHARAA